LQRNPIDNAAIMQKLIILANTLLKADRKWIDKPA
jgi:hypothetical protein